MLAQAQGGGRHFFHQGRVLLRGLVHLHHGFTDLRDASALLAAGGTDFGNDGADTVDSIDYALHGGASLVDLIAANFHARDAVTDEGFDFARRIGTAASELPHFSRYHGKTAALLTCACSLHSGIERQDVGLERNRVNHTNDVSNFAAAGVDALHGLDHPAHGFAALAGNV